MHPLVLRQSPSPKQVEASIALWHLTMSLGAGMQVGEALAWCGVQLLQDERLRAICSKKKVAACDPGLSQDSSLRLLAAAQQASAGSFRSLRDFQKAVKRCAALSTSPRSQGNVAALSDQVDSWCYSIAAALKLGQHEAA